MHHSLTIAKNMINRKLCNVICARKSQQYTSSHRSHMHECNTATNNVNKNISVYRASFKCNKKEEVNNVHHPIHYPVAIIIIANKIYTIPI